VKKAVVALWLILGVAIWNGFNDINVSRGQHEYKQMRLDHELGRGPDPDMQRVMARAQRQGVVAGSIWSLVVVAAGLGTFWMGQRSVREQ
jgi:hypothetical protein